MEANSEIAKLIDIVYRQESELRRLTAAIESLGIVAPSEQFLPPGKAAKVIQRVHPNFSQRSFEYCRRCGFFEENVHWIEASLPGSEVPRYHYNAAEISKLLSRPRQVQRSAR